MLLNSLQQSLSGQLDYYNEYIDEPRFSDPQYILAFREFVGRKYAGQSFDLIITAQRPALSFITKYGEDLFPNTPVFFVAGKGLEISNERPKPNFTGVLYKVDLRPQIDLILRLQPNVKRIFAVTGASLFDRHYEEGAKNQWREFEKRLTFTYSSGQPLDELKQTVAHLPSDCVVVVVPFTEDRDGNKFLWEEALSQIASAANVPVYSFTDVGLGHGTVGGSLLSIDKIFQEAAPFALRLLQGEKPDDIPVTEVYPNVLEFDWNQLRRFKINESSLPAGSVVLFREPTFWELYKWRIIIVTGLILFQTGLIVGLLFERSQKRRASQRLVRSEERFAKAFKANPQPMSVTTLAEGRYLDVNESFQLMSGYTPNEVIGHTSNELGHYANPADRNSLLVEPLLGSGVVRNFELKFRTKDGSLRTLLSSAELIELAGEKCILLASSDITDRKELEQELKRSEREFSTLVENSPDIIARLDHDLRYVYISPGLERATGVSTDRFIGRTAPEVALDGYDAQSLEVTCREAINTKQPTSRAFDFGGRHYWTRIVPEFAADGAVESVMTISEDVTDRIRAQEELLQLTSQLFRLQDEERRRIARELHDGTAQNLFGISVNLAKLNQLTEDKPEAKRLIDECETLGNESLQEIRTLSYLLHPPLLDEAGLVSALQWYVQGFTKRSGIYVDVTTQPMDRLPADVELAFFRIVQESLTNVRRHSGSETASIRLETRSGEVVLEIQDRGRGMSAPKISEDFYDLIEVGVGIPGMRQRLVQLGGRLEVTSNTYGTTITASLPLTNGAHHVANPSRGRS